MIQSRKGAYLFYTLTNIILFCLFLIQSVVLPVSTTSSWAETTYDDYCLSPDSLFKDYSKAVDKIIHGFQGDRDQYLGALKDTLIGSTGDDLRQCLAHLNEKLAEDKTNTYVIVAIREVERLIAAVEAPVPEQAASPAELSSGAPPGEDGPPDSGAGLPVSEISGFVRGNQRKSDLLVRLCREFRQGSESTLQTLVRILLAVRVLENPQVSQIIDNHLTFLLFYINPRYKVQNVSAAMTLEKVLFLNTGGIRSLGLKPVAELQDGFPAFADLFDNQETIQGILEFYKYRETQFRLEAGQDVHSYMHPKFQAYKKASLVFSRYCDLRHWDSALHTDQRQMEVKRPYITDNRGRNANAVLKAKQSITGFAKVFGFKSFGISALLGVKAYRPGDGAKFVIKNAPTLPSQQISATASFRLAETSGLAGLGGTEHEKLAQGTKYFSYNLYVLLEENKKKYLSLTSNLGQLKIEDMEILFQFPGFHGTALKLSDSTIYYIDFYRAQLVSESPIAREQGAATAGLGGPERRSKDAGFGTGEEAEAKKDALTAVGDDEVATLIGRYIKEAREPQTRVVEEKIALAREAIGELLREHNVLVDLEGRMVRSVSIKETGERLAVLMESNAFKELTSDQDVPEVICTQTLYFLLKDILGGKGAGLVVMAATRKLYPDLAKVYTVPDGIIYTTLAFVEEQWDEEPLDVMCRDVDFDKGELVSVRSGAPISMPGAMSTILYCGLTPDNIEAFRDREENQLQDEDALRMYQYFLTKFTELVFKITDRDLIDRSFLETGDAIRKLEEEGSLTLQEKAEHYLGTIVRIQAEITDAVSDEECSAILRSPRRQILMARSGITDSWKDPDFVKNRKRIYFSTEEERARYERMGTAVVIQKMVVGLSGVSFSQDSVTAETQVDEETEQLLPIGTVSGLVASAIVGGVVSGQAIDKATGIALGKAMERLADFYGDAVDVEFTVAGGALHLLQVRPVVLTPRARLNYLFDAYKRGKITLNMLLHRLYPDTLNMLITIPVLNVNNNEDLYEEGETPAAKNEKLRMRDAEGTKIQGVGASPGVAEGFLVVKTKGEQPEDLERRIKRDYKDKGKKVILLADSFHKKDIGDALAIVDGIISPLDTMMSHGAIWARAAGTPAVVDYGTNIKALGFKNGDRLGIDGSRGYLFDLGKDPKKRLDARPPLENLTLIELFKEIDDNLDTELTPELLAVLLSKSDIFEKENGDPDATVAELRTVITKSRIMGVEELRDNIGIVVKEGDEPDPGEAFVYIVISENIEIWRKGHGAQNTRRAVLPTATLVGEASVLSQVAEYDELSRTRRSTVKVDPDKAIVIEISERTFMHYFRNHAEAIGQRVVETIRRQKKRTEGHVPVSENIGRGVDFVIEGEEEEKTIQILGPDGQELLPETALDMPQLLERGVIRNTIDDLLPVLNAYTLEGFSDCFINPEVVVFEGSNESRAAGALACIRGSVLYIDRVLFDPQGGETVIRDMTIVHELLHAYLRDQWEEMEIAAIKEAIRATGSLLAEEIITKADAFSEDPDTHKMYLRHYYARYYLQNNKHSGYVGSANELLTYGIRLTAAAAILGVPRSRVEEILDGGFDRDTDAKNKLLKLIVNGPEGPHRLTDLFIGSAEQVHRVIQLLVMEIFLVQKQRLDAFNEELMCEVIAAMLLKEAEEETWPQDAVPQSV